MSSSKVAVVTGGNKGIGFEIVKGLCEKFTGTVYLTARDISRGEEAVSKLNKFGLQPVFYQLDITDENSIKKLKDHLLQKHGGLDLLINNAAVLWTNANTEQTETIISVNYFSTLKVCDIIFPILRNDARVINMSSSAGHLSQIKSADLRAKFNDPSLNIPQLNQLLEKFLQDVKYNKEKEEGWGSGIYVAYSVSKVGVSALTKIQQREFDREIPNRNICVNSVHPGYVKTDMTDQKGFKTPEEGAYAPLLVALESSKLKGQYIWSDGKIVEWDAPKLDAPY